MDRRFFHFRYFWPTYFLLAPQLGYLALRYVPGLWLLTIVTGAWIVIGVLSLPTLLLASALSVFLPVHRLFGIDYGRGWPTGQGFAIDLIAFNIIFVLLNYLVARRIVAKRLVQLDRPQE